MSECNEKAVEVAWKLRRHVYKRPDGAVLALQRACRGLTCEQASNAIGIAERLLDEAIRICEPRDLKTLTQYRLRIPNGPERSVMLQYERALKENFPACSLEACRMALSIAVVYHIL